MAVDRKPLISGAVLAQAIWRRCGSFLKLPAACPALACKLPEAASPQARILGALEGPCHMCL